MKIAIHHTQDSFSQRWIDYCENNNIDFKLVNCYNNSIIQQLSDCDALMWNFSHKSPKASKFAKQLLYSLQAAGKRVFPDYKTVWHFDDKVGQKYLLEAIGVPLAPAYVFYSKKDALLWADQTNYPKVFKLRNGSGSDNVRLVKSKRVAIKLIKRAFGTGFKQYNAWSNLKERYRKYRLGLTTFHNVAKGIVRLAHTTEYSKITGREVGYIYFQDFIPGNDHDIRVIVIGDKAIALKRMVRKNDFRASGSGDLHYERALFSENLLELAFKIASKIGSQCIAMDFVHMGNTPLLVEISYGFPYRNFIEGCQGYWDNKLTWHDGDFNVYGWMVEEVIKK